MRAILCYLLLCLASPAFGQTGLIDIFTVDEPAGTVSVFAENHGFVPLTVHLNARLYNMRSSIPLPSNLVVFPGKKPKLIATYSHERGSSYSFRNFVSLNFGISNNKAPDSTYVYGLPFRRQVDWHWPTAGKKDKTPADRFPYFFNLPDNTPICAAREGIVTNLWQESKHNNRERSNTVVVFHEDGSYALYQNLQYHKAAVTMGQRVAKGDVLSYYVAEKKAPLFWFTLLYPGFDEPKDAPVRFEGVTDYGQFKFRR